MRSHCSAMPSKKIFILIAHSPFNLSLSLSLSLPTLPGFALSRAIKLFSFPRFSLRSPSHRCHQASLFSPINKPLSESPSLCLCRFTLTHRQIRFHCHQASLFSPITKPLSPSLAFLSDHQAAVRITKPLPIHRSSIGLSNKIKIKIKAIY